MLNIIKENVLVNSHYFAYKLENGILLHDNEWNGEKYIVYDKNNNREICYIPIYSKKMNETDSYDIIGFKEW